MKHLQYLFPDKIGEFGAIINIEGTKFYSSELVFLNDINKDSEYSREIYPYYKNTNNEYHNRTNDAVPANCVALIGPVKNFYRHKNVSANKSDAIDAEDLILSPDSSTWNAASLTEESGVSNYSMGKAVSGSETTRQGFLIQNQYIRGSRQNKNADIDNNDYYNSPIAAPRMEGQGHQVSSEGTILYQAGRNLSFAKEVNKYLFSNENSTVIPDETPSATVKIPSGVTQLYIAVSIPGEFLINSSTYEPVIRATASDSVYFTYGDLNTSGDMLYYTGSFNDETQEYQHTKSYGVSSNTVRIFLFNLPSDADSLIINHLNIFCLDSDGETLGTWALDKLSNYPIVFQEIIDKTLLNKWIHQTGQKIYNSMETHEILANEWFSYRGISYNTYLKSGLPITLNILPSYAYNSYGLVFGRYPSAPSSVRDMTSIVNYTLIVQPQNFILNEPTTPNPAFSIIHDYKLSANNKWILHRDLVQYKMGLGFAPNNPILTDYTIPDPSSFWSYFIKPAPGQQYPYFQAKTAQGQPLDYYIDFAMGIIGAKDNYQNWENDRTLHKAGYGTTLFF